MFYHILSYVSSYSKTYVLSYSILFYHNLSYVLSYSITYVLSHSILFYHILSYVLSYSILYFIIFYNLCFIIFYPMFYHIHFVVIVIHIDVILQYCLITYNMSTNDILVLWKSIITIYCILMR